MGGWQRIRHIGRTAARTRVAKAALSLTAHVVILGGLLVANPWRQQPVVHAPPLIVDLVTFAVSEEKAAEDERAAPAAPPVPAPVPSSSPRLKPAVSKPEPKSEPKPEPAPEPAPGGITLELPARPAPPDSAGEGGTGTAADGTGQRGVDPAVGQAIAALICRRMDEDERYLAGCAEQPRVDPFERPPAIALLTPEEKRIQAIRTQQLARTAGYDNFLEWYLEHDSAIPKTLPGGLLGPIDNSIFVDRKDEATMAHDRLMRGGTMDWEDEIAEAHGRE